MSHAGGRQNYKNYKIVDVKCLWIPTTLRKAKWYRVNDRWIDGQSYWVKTFIVQMSWNTYHSFAWTKWDEKRWRPFECCNPLCTKRPWLWDWKEGKKEIKTFLFDIFLLNKESRPIRCDVWIVERTRYPTDEPTDRQTDRPTDRPTDVQSQL